MNFKTPIISNSNNLDENPIKIYRLTNNGELEEVRSLDSNQVLLIIDEKRNRIWVWRGKLTKSIQHYRFSQFARKLKMDDHGMKMAKIIYVDEGDEPKDFPNIKHFYKEIAEDMKHESELPDELKNRYVKILEEFLEKSEIKVVIISNIDGMPIISLDRETRTNLTTNDEVMISGMTASLLNLSTKTSIILKSGEFEQFIMKSKDGQMMLFEIDENRLIICNLPLKASIGVTVLALKNAIKQIKKIK
ncbi:MAG: roadblock/LC7 domain-containing protein [Candidatus Helarchaeota archaeon]